VNKTELESKHLSELHALAAEAGVERYRMLPRAELIEKLAGGEARRESRPRGGQRPKREQRPQRQRRERKPREDRKPLEDRKPREEPAAPVPEPPSARAPAEPAAAERPKRRRRRRWGRRRKGVRVHDLLLPATPGGRAIVYAADRAGCTALLRELASELGGESKGPDPIALLIDPSPEELADWKREAPAAEIVAASKAAHAEDALGQAARRAQGGEDVIVLIDSLTRFGEDFAGAREARELFDAGLAATGGTLTVVAALERSA
jgi:transcription termination factor Rho